MAIIHLVDYHRYWLDRENHIVNPDFDKNSSLILSLKYPRDSRFNTAIDHFYNLLKTELQKHILPDEMIYAAIVPSSKQGEYSHGMGYIVKKLRSSFRIINTKNPLVRKHNIDKLAQGGSRDITVHLNSIQVDTSQIGRGNRILLLDDVTTTGGSLTACTHILNAAGSGEVLAIALAKTSA